MTLATSWVSRRVLLPSEVLPSMRALLSALANSGNSYAYLVVDTAMNAPRFLALAAVIGCLYEQGNEGERVQQRDPGVELARPDPSSLLSDSILIRTLLCTNFLRPKQ